MPKYRHDGIIQNHLFFFLFQQFTFGAQVRTSSIGFNINEDILHHSLFYLFLIRSFYFVLFLRPIKSVGYRTRESKDNEIEVTIFNKIATVWTGYVKTRGGPYLPLGRLHIPVL